MAFSANTTNRSWVHARGASETIPLASIARDPTVAAFLGRGEGDADQFAVPAYPRPVLAGGEAVFA
jgi:hypothetical protein